MQLWDSPVCQASRVSAPEASAEPVGLSLPQLAGPGPSCHCAPLACPGVSLLLQNVLLQMGLHVLAVNGMLIRQARSYILRCHGCFRCWG